MKFRNIRITTALVTFGLFVALAGLIAPTALGASGDKLVFVNHPQDAEVGETITSTRLDDGISSVVVKLVDGAGGIVTNSKALVTFTLATGSGLASGTLQVIAQPLVNGFATFGPGSLKILSENEPQFTDYRLSPRTTKNPLITGDPSGPFDIWEDGEACDEGGDPCEAFLRGSDGDHYSLSADGTLGASELVGVGVLPELTCPGQRVVFTNRVFSYATTETDDVTPDTPVLLRSTITKAEWKATASNGQAHADWCIGLPTNAPWERNGASSRVVDFNGVLVPGGILYVALAPRCPVANPSGSAPCIVSQNPDGNGGSLTIGWLTGGDPPRRT